MSISKYAKHQFLSIQKLPEKFQFMPSDWREMTTKFGTGIYFLGEVVAKSDPDQKVESQIGLLRCSPTTMSSLQTLGFKELDELLTNVIYFEYDEGSRTILVKDVQNWTGETLVRQTEDPKKKKTSKSE